MLFNKKLFHHSSNWPLKLYVFLITTFAILLSMAGCDACGNTTVDNRYATELHVTLAPTKLFGPHDTTTEVTIATIGGESQVGRYKDFDMEGTFEVSGEAGNSCVKFTGYDTNGNPVPRVIQFSNEQPIKAVKGPLSEYFGGGVDFTLEYKQTERATLYFEPDLKSGVRSMKITFTVTNHITHQTIFVGTAEWKRSSYELKILDLDENGFIPSEAGCIVQVSKTDPEDSITVGELDDLWLVVKQDLDDPTAPHFNEAVTIGGEQVVTLRSGELADGKLNKKLSVNPGISKQPVTFTLILYSSATGEEGEGEAVAIAKYQREMKPYELTVDKDKLEGANKTVEVKIRDSGGKDLKLEELEHLQLWIKRTEGSAAKVSGDTGGGEEFQWKFFKDGGALTLSPDQKFATKQFTIEPGADLRAAFKSRLVDSEGKDMADQQPIIHWEIGIEVEISYNNSNKFDCKFKNTTNQLISNLRLEWKGLAKTDAHVETGTQGSKDIMGISANSTKNIELPVDWKTEQAAQFQFTVKIGDGVVVYQKEHSIAQNAPRLSISLEKPKDLFKVGDPVQLKIKAEEEVDEEGLKLVKLVYTPSNSAELVIGNQDVRNKSVHEILQLAGKGSLTRLLKGTEEKISLTIDPKSSHSGGSFTDLHLEGSYKDIANPNKIGKINWIGTVRLTMSQVADGGRIIDTNPEAWVADKMGGLSIKFKNESLFSVDRSILESMKLTITAADPSKAPQKVVFSHKNIDLAKNKVTLWDVWEALNKKDSQLGVKEELEMHPTIQGAETNQLTEFTINLEGPDVNIAQKVRYGSPYAGQLAIVGNTQSLLIDQVRDTDTPIILEFKIQNRGDSLSKDQLANIIVHFARIIPPSTRPKRGPYGTMKFNTVSLGSVPSKLDEKAGLQAKLDFFEGMSRKFKLDNHQHIDLAKLLEAVTKEDKLDKNGEIPVKFSLNPLRTDKPRNFLVCLVDKNQGIVIAKKEVKEK
jgi:hypothetical protein